MPSELLLFQLCYSKEQTAARKRLMLMNICKYIERNTKESEENSIFSLDYNPCTLPEYIQRLLEYVDKFGKDDFTSTFSPGIVCTLFALVYLARAQVVLSNSTRFLYIQTALMMAIKIHEDCDLSTKEWSKASGCYYPDLVQMEAAFCEKINFRFFVSPEEFKAKLKEVKRD